MTIKEPTGPEKSQYEIPAETKALLEAYSVKLEMADAPLLLADKNAIESKISERIPGRRDYGSVPYFSKRNEILEHLPEEVKKLTKDGKHFQPGKAPWFIDASYAISPVLFEMKFGKRLSEFAEKILANYPDLNEGKTEGQKQPGKEISVFGLSGSGKSTAVEALREQLGKEAVVIDSDTVRYNLLAKALKEVEVDAGGASMDDLRNNLLHNAISGPLYFLLNHVTKELKERGYTIINSAAMPTQGADKTIYIEHPDGVDPSDDTQVPATPERQKTESPEQKEAREKAEAEAKPRVAALAKTLYKRTAERTQGADDYDWDHPETILDFNKMKPVTVQVPEHVHASFLTNTKNILRKGTVDKITNPKIEDPIARKKNFQEQFAKILS